MSDAAVENPGAKRISTYDKGDHVAMSSLSGDLLRAASMETNSGAEDPSDLASNRGASGPLLGGTAGSGEGLQDDLPPQVGQRWMSFAGIRAAQILADYWLWEALLNGGQRTIKGIVELGTGKGGFSLFLAAQAHARDLFFRTYDVAPPDCSVPGFVQLDIYACADEIGRHLERNDPVILFCDGGNKPRELKTFSRYLSGESLVVVHDWGTEMLPTNVPDNVTEVYGDLCDEIGSMSRCFQVRA